MPFGSENKTEKCMHILITGNEEDGETFESKVSIAVNDDVIKTGYNRAFQGKIMNMIWVMLNLRCLWVKWTR